MNGLSRSIDGVGRAALLRLPSTESDGREGVAEGVIHADSFRTSGPGLARGLMLGRGLGVGLSSPRTTHFFAPGVVDSCSARRGLVAPGVANLPMVREKTSVSLNWASVSSAFLTLESGDLARAVRRLGLRRANGTGSGSRLVVISGGGRSVGCFLRFRE